MTPNRLSFAALLLAGSAFVCSAPAFAQSPPHHGSGSPHFTFAHRDAGHFSPMERRNWTGGHWSRSSHNGRFGWWWFAGGAWYFYDTPTYPYPGYVSDYYADDDYGPGSSGGPSWYYCASPPGYYPYVQTCSAPWQPVPAGGSSGYGPPQGGQPQGGPYNQPPPGYQGQGAGNGPDNGPPGDQGPPGYAPGGPPGYQGGPDNGPDNGPPPGYQGPPGYPQGGPPPGYQGGPPPGGQDQGGDQPPPGYGPPPPGNLPPPSGGPGYNGPN